ncbi:class I SAM-dependent methyltransferase [Ignatzschineria cameli]|uniref:Methyltransferase n=1 Tax=Ignatzschineria cameli TaxID=2182793 RepID=A0A2U2ATJ5_9GAMM|nr:methyltransferase [Ignatzschineria cameli]PWD87496.1 methyltransferase [Ignatzschineria cameli]PWD88006.1 methyltransferase [Ignatzschineria cameli]PWD91038.1 methyltransferase [Ignatzschineria cameli]PWD92680.1 methyltransferase [Ignatzschineria cameli]PWD93700.1 methyltransferase [Ignatzschineria cameli]
MASSYKKHLTYIQGFIQSPRSIGTLMPSSPTLCRAMISELDWKQPNLRVAELGAGDGVLTKHILRAMPADSTLSAFEINPLFFADLEGIQDQRLILYKHSAEKLTQPYNIIFSCLPFLSLPLRVSLKILRSVLAILESTGGDFILFQYTQRMERVLSRYFQWERKRVMKNFPPAYVYHCRAKIR